MCPNVGVTNIPRTRRNNPLSSFEGAMFDEGGKIVNIGSKKAK